MHDRDRDPEHRCVGCPPDRAVPSSDLAGPRDRGPCGGARPGARSAARSCKPPVSRLGNGTQTPPRRVVVAWARTRESPHEARPGWHSPDRSHRPCGEAWPRAENVGTGPTEVAMKRDTCRGFTLMELIIVVMTSAVERRSTSSTWRRPLVTQIPHRSRSSCSRDTSVERGRACPRNGRAERRPSPSLSHSNRDSVGSYSHRGGRFGGLCRQLRRSIQNELPSLSNTMICPSRPMARVP